MLKHTALKLTFKSYYLVTAALVFPPFPTPCLIDKGGGRDTAHPAIVPQLSHAQRLCFKNFLCLSRSLSRNCPRRLHPH